MGNFVAEVAFKVPVDSTFDYNIPAHLRDEVRPGRRLLAPFGPRRMVGYCVSVKDRSEYAELKNIISVVDPEVSLSDNLLKLGMWISANYLEPPGMVLEAMLPAAVRKRAKSQKVRVARLNVTAQEARKAARELREKHPARAALLSRLADLDGEVPVNELAQTAGVSASVAGTLARMGLVVIVTRDAAPSPIDEIAPSKKPHYTLTDGQRTALGAAAKAIESPAGALLLHGATGSGKTEVYIRAIEKVVAREREAIVLVPEISLTPQTISRFASRFDSLAVLHSALTEAQRRDQWLRIARGGAQVVIGARSAIFAPTKRLGIIVIDEEHEPSFKQSTSPRYHARDVALERGRLEDAAVILGSATPSLEAFRLAETKKIAAVRIKHRIDDLPMPPVETIDMRSEKPAGKGPKILSRKLRHLIEGRIKRSEQVMLFLNRRGFATFIVCRRCGLAMRCPQCAVAMRYHRARGRLLCHYCGHSQPAPRECPDCNAPMLHYAGTGTEKLLEEVSRVFPDARIARMDSDTMKNRRDYIETLSAFERGEIDILLGTQMIAKGLDFPNLTLVGIVAADAGLISGDFRSGERTFQLIEHVSGRTGRAKLGYVVLQTYAPEASCIQKAARHDYRAFVEEELSTRAALGYPPAGKLIRIVAQGREKKYVETAVNRLAGRVREALGDRGVLLGPAPAPIERLQGQWRFHMLVKLKENESPGLLREALRNRKAARGVSVAVDVDPHDML